MAKWFVVRGAKNLILTSRSGVRTGYQKRKILHMERFGAQVVVSKCDIKSQSDAEKLLAEASNLGPVSGIYHLAGVSEYLLFIF